MKLRLLCLGALLAFQPASFAGTNGIAAVVNGRPILKSEVEERTRALSAQLRRDYIGSELTTKLKVVYDDALETLVRQELVLKEYEPFAASNEAKMKAITEDHIKDYFIKEMFQGDRSKLLAELKLAGKSYEKFYEEQKKGLIVQSMLGQATRDNQPITSDDKERYLAEHGEEFRDGDAIKLWTITVPMDGELGTTPESQRLLAVEVRNRLLKGADFSELAKTHSADSKSSAGGDWGWVTKKDINRPLAERVFKLPAKKISDVIQIEDRFYIFWIEAKKPGLMKPRDQIEPELEARVKAERRKKAQDEYIEKLKRKATIRYTQK